MADFTRQLRPASFRGVSFDVPEDDNGFGRRVISHEYPGRDEPFHEDMGAALKSFSVTAVILGADFLSAAAALEAAIMKAGPGPLVHPHYGEVTVIVKDARRQHSFAAVGEVRFQITFEKYGAPQFPTSLGDTAAGLGLASGNLFDAIKGEFNSRFNLTSITDFVSADGVARANGFVNGLKTIFSQGGVPQFLGELPVFDELTGGLVDDVIGLFQNIASFTRPKSIPIIGSVSSAPVATAAEAKGIMKGLTSTMSLRAIDTDTVTTTNRAIRHKNAAALDGLFRGAAAAALGETARYAAYDSKEDAIAFRSQAADQISNLRDQYGAEGWDDSWRSTGQLLAALSRDINDRIGRLPRTVRIRPQNVRTSLDLANRLYGDDPAAIFDKADDLSKRNAVRHPGFVPAKELEVLINAS